MGPLNVRRLILGGAASTALALPSAVLFVAPAAASDLSTPNRIVESVGPNGDATKTVTASCLNDEKLLSVGGRVVDGGGDVILTGIVPNVTEHSVTVTARLPVAAPPRVWSLVAYAVCVDTPDAPVLVTSPASSTMAATTVQCPSPTKVLGTGFHLTATSGRAFINRLEADVNLDEVHVSGVKGPMATTTLTAFAICFPVVSPLIAVKRVNTEVIDHAATAPQTATVSNPATNVQFYGVGGRVTGPHADEIMIDALIPAPDTNQAHVQVNRAMPLGPAPLGGAAMARIAVDPDEVAASTSQTGTFC